jgi:hypothetical protein
MSSTRKLAQEYAAKIAYAESQLQPYMAELESPDGLAASVSISGVAILVAAGAANASELRRAVALASRQCGIPFEALHAHAEATVAMMRAINGPQINKTSRF